MIQLVTSTGGWADGRAGGRAHGRTGAWADGWTGGRGGEGGEGLTALDIHEDNCQSDDQQHHGTHLDISLKYSVQIIGLFTSKGVLIAIEACACMCAHVHVSTSALRACAMQVYDIAICIQIITTHVSIRCSFVSLLDRLRMCAASEIRPLL